MNTSIRTTWIAVILLLAKTLAADEPKILFEERFAGQLDQDWSWVREDPKSWRMQDGSLAVVANGGSMWRSLNNYKNLLMRPAPGELKAGFQFEVLLDNQPKQQFEHAGIALRFDDDNYVCFNKEFLGKGKLLLISEVDSVPVMPGVTRDYEPQAVWLRLVVGDGKAIGYYRAENEKTWTKLGELKLPPSDKQPQIGLVAGLGKEGREARFRSFRVMESASQPPQKAP